MMMFIEYLKKFLQQILVQNILQVPSKKARAVGDVNLELIS